MSLEPYYEVASIGLRLFQSVPAGIKKGLFLKKLIPEERVRSDADTEKKRLTFEESAPNKWPFVTSVPGNSQK